MKTIVLETHQRNEMIDITDIIEKALRESGMKDGVCYVFVPHTTAGITISENADPDVKIDMLNTLSKLAPYKDNYLHKEGNSDAHIKASLMGNTATVLIEQGRLMLGTWQSLFFCEFDGPRKRNVYVKAIGNI